VPHLRDSLIVAKVGSFSRWRKSNNPTHQKLEFRSSATAIPFHWTDQNSSDWDILKYCSEACSGLHAGEKDAALEAAILQLLAERAADGDRSKTICPPKPPN
jgi:hypothetical protein